MTKITLSEKALKNIILDIYFKEHEDLTEEERNAFESYFYLDEDGQAFFAIEKAQQ